ncbi:hypothetical protein BT96DRAFT_944378 [Gymnopus androsaceus JB14]|uniref:DUF5648 domain-containing protein n=1 Tax=Gymnopus androsaceus JB14 TaxID=1447944 RepID=A0A6A4H4X7_9AGAR|nr:hypothetical protein BT96DRAFT_944378 [Gymnopus androsaceus JB14]
MLYTFLPTLVFLLSRLAFVHAQTCADTSALVPFWRALNGAITDHFYTTNVTELNVAIKGGYSLEGASAFIWTTQQPGTTPLYRLYSTSGGDHFYTINNGELADMKAAGWELDTTPIAGYVYPYSICGASPIYRLFDPVNVDHFYTMNISESEAAISKLGFQDQGIAGFAVLASADGSVVINTPTPFLLPATVTASPESQTSASAAACATSSDAIPLLRAFSSVGSDHFYTTNSSEMSNAVAVDAYTFEGDATFLWASQETGTVPLYRLFNQNVTDHFYTIDAYEVNETLSQGYAFDTPTHIAGYVYPYSMCGASPIYRLYSSSDSDHFYTMSYTESLSAAGWVIEGIAGFALLPSTNGAAQTATADASPFFLPVSLAPSVTSVSLTLESALSTTTAKATSTTNGAAGFNPSGASAGTTVGLSGTSLPASNAAIARTGAHYYGVLCVAALVGAWVS